MRFCVVGTLVKNARLYHDGMCIYIQAKSSQKDIASMKPQAVREFIRSLGSAYEKYAKSFKVRGSQLIMFNEAQLQNFVPVKLHRHRILMEIARNTPNRADAHLFNHDVDALHWDASKVRLWCKSNQITKIYAEKFYNHGVDGMLLFELDDEDLSTIGVKKIHRQKVLEIISKFASDTFPGDNVWNIFAFLFIFYFVRNGLE